MKRFLKKIALSLWILTSCETAPPNIDNLDYEKWELDKFGCSGERMKMVRLLVENNDVPGVIGNVGTLLGNLNINIAAYLLNRSGEDGKAFAVIRVDNRLSNDDLIKLSEIQDIQSVNQIHLLN